MVRRGTHHELLVALVDKGQVPVIAIFPADRSKPPIVFLGGYTSGGLIDAIEEAGIKKQ